jgi:hypothetical protein
VPIEERPEQHRNRHLDVDGFGERAPGARLPQQPCEFGPGRLEDAQPPRFAERRIPDPVRDQVRRHARAHLGKLRGRLVDEDGEKIGAQIAGPARRRRSVMTMNP